MNYNGDVMAINLVERRIHIEKESEKELSGCHIMREKGDLGLL